MVLALSTSYHEKSKYAPFSADVQYRLREVAGNLSDGDIVFRTGRDMISRLVLSQGDSPRFSHVGIILKQGNLMVVHSLPQEDQSPGGVKVEPLSVFASANNASDIDFYRVKGINTNLRNKIREYALRQVGKPFDDDFLMREDGKFYCTKLVLKALTSAGINMTASVVPIHVMLLSEPVVPPDSLRQSTQLERIMPNPAFERDAPKAARP